MHTSKYVIPLITSVILAGCSGSSTPETAEPLKEPGAMKLVDEVPDTMKPVDNVDIGTPVVPVVVPVVVPRVLPTVSTPALNLSFTTTKAFHFSWVPVTGATSYKIKEAITVASGFEEVPIIDTSLTTTPTATSFDHVVPLYARLNAKYMLESCIEQVCTQSVEIYTSSRLAEMVDSIGYFKASNTDAEDLFGYSVSISADGNTLAVSARDESSNSTSINAGEGDNNANKAGAVYVFARDSKTSAVWTQQAYLKAGNAGADDRFGESVSVSDDGNTLVVGADSEDGSASSPIDTNTGAVYVFARDSNADWSQEAYLQASDKVAGDRFGDSVSVSGDGNTIAVGAFAADGGPESELVDAGAVYVFVRAVVANMKVWVQQANIITASNAAAYDYFGTSVSLTADGNTLAVGAYGEDSDSANAKNQSASSSGAAYVFVRGGIEWTRSAYLKASNIGMEDRFGASVSISAYGNTLAVGAYGESSTTRGINSTVNERNNDANYAGAVYIFTPNVSNEWSEKAYLKASNTRQDTGSFGGDNFGFSVSLSADGNALVVGAKGESSDATGISRGQSQVTKHKFGAVYTFTRSGMTWSQQSYLKASNAGSSNASFGSSVAISSDGDTLVVGALREDIGVSGINPAESSGAAIASGAVYVY